MFITLESLPVSVKLNFDDFFEEGGENSSLYFKNGNSLMFFGD